MYTKRTSYSSLISTKGSVEFQVYHLTNKVLRLTLHLEQHSKDYSSRRGLRKILGKRKRLLAYLAKNDLIRYQNSINQLGIRKSLIR
uniref:Small ribosomal subunit protein uS15c n=2 Tax=Ophioglossum TaxID=13833 RepID=L7T4V5_9MONI|nr:ribosomal protein S15 [Ophioglossum californicum]AGC26766.1 ribosomal protein S15 [Ophioglossum californicum]QXF60139.1 ribosomal protein S15 [Ophioglossum vulgatum]